MLSCIKYLKTFNLPRYLVLHLTLLGTLLQVFFSKMARYKRVSKNKWYPCVKHCFHILWLIWDTLSTCYETQTELAETLMKIYPQVISPYERNLHLEKCVKFRVVPDYIKMDEKGHGIRTRWCDTVNVTQWGSGRNTNYSTTTKYSWNLHTDNSCTINQWLQLLKQELSTMLKWELTK